MVDNYIPDKVLDKIKMIEAIEKFDIKTGDKLPGNVTLKNVGILITCIIKDNDKFNQQIILEEALVAYNEQYRNILAALQLKVRNK